MADDVVTGQMVRGDLVDEDLVDEDLVDLDDDLDDDEDLEEAMLGVLGEGASPSMAAEFDGVLTEVAWCCRALLAGDWDGLHRAAEQLISASDGLVEAAAAAVVNGGPRPETVLRSMAQYPLGAVGVGVTQTLAQADIGSLRT